MKRFVLAGAMWAFCLSAALWAGIYGGGMGTIDHPYVISLPQHWQELSDSPSEWGLCFKITANIDLSQSAVQPIGTYTNKFTGILDGQDFIIENVTIHLSTVENVGLFGYVAEPAQIKNVHIRNISVKGSKYVGGFVGCNETSGISHCRVSGSISGTGRYVGGFAGSNYRSLVDCRAECSVSGAGYVGGFSGDNEGALLRCYAEGQVTGVADYTGGLAGYNNRTVSYCSSAGPVSGTRYVGGLIGNNDGALVSDSFSSAVVLSAGDYCGGLVGYIRDDSVIKRCYATGAITGKKYAGGLAGTNKGAILESYAVGTVTGQEYLGGAVGFLSDPGRLENVYAAGNITGPEYRGGLVGFNSRAKVIHCYAIGQLTGTEEVGGLCSYVNAGDDYEDRGNFWDIETSTMSTSAMGRGLKTGGMQTRQTYIDAGWDFTDETDNGTADIWRMCADGTGYPKLTWQITAGDFLCPDGVNMDDFNYFSGKWMLSGCTTDNNYCGGADMNFSGRVDLADFAVFAAHWLEGV